MRRQQIIDEARTMTELEADGPLTRSVHCRTSGSVASSRGRR